MRDTTCQIMLGKIIATQYAVAVHLPPNDGSAYRRHYEAALEHLEAAEDQMRRAVREHELRRGIDIITGDNDAPVMMYR